MERIEVFLNNKNSIKNSYICFINANYIKDRENTDSNKEEIYNLIDERLNNFTIDIKNKFKNLNFTINEQKFIENTNEDKIWAWQSVVVKVKLSK